MGHLLYLRGALEAVIQPLHSEGVPECGQQILPQERPIDHVHGHQQPLRCPRASPQDQEVHETALRNRRAQQLALLLPSQLQLLSTLQPTAPTHRVARARLRLHERNRREMPEDQHTDSFALRFPQEQGELLEVHSGSRLENVAAVP